MAKPGEPEGVATAILPAKSVKDQDTKIESDLPTVYSFTYDAKSTSHSKASTNNINIANIAKHRKDNQADFTLVVAPDFQDGQLGELCETSRVTPMRARDLKKLLIVSAGSGPIDLDKFREVFSLFTPDSVKDWVDAFCTHMTQPKLTLGTLLDLLVSIGHNGPDAISTKVIAHEARRQYSALKDITFREVSTVLSGLQVLFPKLVTIESDKIYLSTTPAQIRQEILAQVKDSPSRQIFGLSE